jgi:hypothetical protein
LPGKSAFDELELNDAQQPLTSYPAVELTGELEIIADRVSNNKEGLQKLADTAAPPDAALVVILCVVLLRPLGYEDESKGWSGAREYLRDPNLVESLRTYSVDKARPNQVSRVRALLENQRGLGEERATAAGRCVYDLLQWTQCVQSKFGAISSPKHANIIELSGRSDGIPASVLSPGK